VPPDARPAPLTERQRGALDALVTLYWRTGRAPTYRELGAELGVASTGYVDHLLGSLEQRGYLRRGYRGWRGIELLAPALEGGHPSLGWAT
jgi:SOS-response transcriptional repressor LexA